MVPETHYARSGDLHIAYQTVGDGPIDLVFVPTTMFHIEFIWTWPALARFYQQLASFSRLILFDRRGSGLSDPVPNPPTLEEEMDDVIAVMDAVGSERAALFAAFEGGAMACLFAATHPDRTSALVLASAWARLERAEDYPYGNPPADRERLVEEVLAQWGGGDRAHVIAPSLAGDPEFREWFGRLERFSMSPGAARRAFESGGRADVRSVLPTVNVPTLVMRRAEDEAIDPGHARYLAEHIEGARYLELPGRDAMAAVGDSDSVVDEVEEFLTGVRPQREPDRILATVLFTDICGSTERAAELGDSRWRDLLGRHDQLVRAELRRHRGREVKSTGDGFLATFDGPARGINAARAIAEGVRRLGIEVRAGLHTGECEVIGNDVGGLAVHIGARVSALAAPGEVLVSSTVRDLVVGSGIQFEERGTHALKGVPDEWRLFAVAGSNGAGPDGAGPR